MGTPDRIDALFEPQKFRAHPEVGFDAATMPIRAALTLSAASSQKVGGFTEEEEPPWGTWFGGRPLVPVAGGDPWPLGPDGRPLAHVVQVDLAEELLNQREAVFALTGLPSSGVFQLFHDLESFGHATDPEEPRGAWKVRWFEVEEDEDLESLVLQEPPDELPDDRRCPPVPLNTAVVATIPPLLDQLTEMAEPDRERYERIYDWLEEAPHAHDPLVQECNKNPHTPWDEDFEPSESVSRMGGYGFVEINPDYVAELHAGLPLEQGDSHVLLMELNPAQVDAPVDWFHGRRPLQVWIRASDLEARRFDEVWCQIRTDA